MASNLSATRDVGRATFLLEVALDRARMKERLAAVLLAERAKRGHGDPRRFAQPAMADLLGYSLRQYQRLEDPDDPNLPGWSKLEAIADKLGLEASGLFGGDADAQVSTATNGEPLQLDESVLRQMVEEAVEGALAETNALLRRLLDEERPESQAGGLGDR